MAQEENGIPVGDDNIDRKSKDFLPRYFRTVANSKFLSSTIDQMIQPGVVEKVDGFLGRKDSKAHKSTDNYVADVSAIREAYQLEPAAVVEDNLGNVLLYKDYRDYMNSTSIRNAQTVDHGLTNTQEYYAWDPHIHWDKFVNFREYYWLPQGPDPIAVYGEFREIRSTISVTAIDNVDNVAYNFNPENPNSNTTLTLYRGQTYTFDIQTPNMPFSIRTARDLEEDSLYNEGVSAQSVDNGTIEFEVDLEAPNYLYYVNENDIEASGLIIVKDILDNTELDVESAILNKKTYEMNNGYALSNGMKVKFYGRTTPEKYATGNWYVEGVGSAIKLISEEDVILTADYLLDDATEFDEAGFGNLPFDNATSYANQRDYICINKAAPDLNQWARYNRWTHKSVIETTATINGTPANLDQNFRAVRPIIEFEAGLKLYNNGSFAKSAVDLVDTITRDVFSTIEGQQGYFIDGTELVTGMRILFTADPDSFVAGKIYEVKFISHNGTRQITLIETDDTNPLENETVFVKSGAKFKGKLFWYNGTKWSQAQDKTGLNQQPLFDIYNGEDKSLTTLDGSSFTGCKIFSYKQGTGTKDTELGFPLTYRTIENSGDIVFDFNLLSDTYTYDNVANVITASTDTGQLRKYKTRTTYDSVEGWTKANTESEQWVVAQPTVGPRTNNFIINWYEKSGDLTDLSIKVYVNNVRNKAYTISRQNGVAYVTFNKNLTDGDKLVIKTKSQAEKNDNGFYEFPMNLEKNPMNENVTTFTLGEVIDHVSSIVDNTDQFDGAYPGVGNLRDIGLLSKAGQKFVKHSGPINLPLFNLTQKDYDMVKAIKSAGVEYLRAKREFIRIASELGFDGDTKIHVDKVLDILNEGKTSSDSFYFSDMVPHGGDKKTTHVVDDASETIFSLTRGIDFTKLSQNAALVYLNGKQLDKDDDYTISTNGFVELKVAVKAQDVVEIYEYESTDGSWIPPTPTKLGLYPKYRPQIFLDDTYISVPAESSGPFKIYGRDETTTNTDYKNKLGWFYPLYTTEAAAQDADRANGGSGQAHDHLFAGYNKLFFMPNSSMNHAVADSAEYDVWQGAQPMIQGHDGSLFKAFGDYRDELLLDLERRIYNNLKQPYDENILDIADFVETKTRKTQFPRTKLAKTMISDFTRWLETVGTPDYSTNTYFDRTNGFTFNYSKFAFIDNTPLAGHWRAVYKDIYNTDRPHSHPWEVLGLTLKPSWWEDVYGEAPYTSNNLLLWEDLSKGIVREPKKKIVYRNKFANANIYKRIPVDDQGYLLSPADAGVANYGVDSSYNDPFIFGDEGPVETAWRRSSHYPFSLITSWAIYQPAKFFGLAFDRSRIARDNAGHLVYIPTSKQIELDQLVFPNSPNDDTRVLTAGLVNYMQGYLNQNDTVSFKQYQTELKAVQNKICAKLGGFTQKEKFRLLLDSRTPTNEGNVFVPFENYKLHLSKSVPLDVYSYSGVIVEVVPEGYIVKGYDRETPIFKTYAPIRKNADLLLTIGGTTESFITWTSGKFYEVGQIVEISDSYFRVKVSHTSGDAFREENFQKLAELPLEGGAQAYFSKNWDTSNIVEVPYGTLYRTHQDVVDMLLGYEQYLLSQGFKFETFNPALEEIENWQLSAKEFLFWVTQNWDTGTLLSLSPSARSIKFEKEFTVVDDIYDNFYEYSLLGTDGKRLLADFASTERTNNNEFGIFVKNTEEGIFNLKVPTVQHEHVLILDNRTVFNDVIYNRPQGYRQERIKVKGYRSDGWNGGYNIPGFIFDDTRIKEWIQYQDYAIGDVVKYKQYFYVAKQNITGTETFEDTFYVRLNERPEANLLPNWDYKAKQFLDFYDLDSDNFDIEQQKLAQHLFGYQNRPYLENIINDDIAQFKFFQGAIREKGTKNVLTKLFDKLGSANKDSLEFFEEWAVRVGRYGATNNDDQFEVVLDEEKFRLSPQPIELVESVDPQDTTLINRYTRNDILVKSRDYNHKPLPTKYFNEENSYLKTSGYVDVQDINLQVLEYETILEKDLSDIPTNSYTWTSKQKNQQTWGVYKHVNNNIKLVSVGEANGTEFTVTTSEVKPFEIGDIIGINSVSDTVNGFYKVKSTSLNKVTLETEENFDEVEDTDGYISTFQNVRVSKTKNVNDTITDPLQFAQQGSDIAKGIVWIDDDDTGKWLVLKNKQVYTQKTDVVNKLAGLLDSTQKDFGNALSVSADNTVLAVSAPKDLNGSVYMYNRPSDDTDFAYIQTINEFSNLFDSNGGFGTSVALSPDKKYLAVGSPAASNLKSKFLGDYRSVNSYQTGDIVLNDAQLWKAKRAIEGDSTVDFVTHASNQQSIGDDYVSATQDYPEIKFMVRGDWTLGENEDTDHILVRAKEDQFLGSKPGDRLFLKWNKYTTTNPTGITPFNGDSVLNEAFLNGEHEIISKVEAVIFFESTLYVPDVGSEIVTSTGKAIVVHRKLNNLNQMNVYLSDINGTISGSGEASQNGILIGNFERKLQIGDNYHEGWWRINVGSTFSSTELEETNANLVVQTIKLENENPVTPDFTNILDVLNQRDLTEPTRPSQLGVLSHVQGQTNINQLDGRWWFRSELTAGASMTVGDKFRFWLNDIYKDGIRQEPTAINLTFDYLNYQEHEVDDIWDGYIDVRLTNFDLNGDPFIPQEGNIITCTTSGESAEVAYIDRDFASARIFIKNKTGVFSKGGNFGESSNATFIQNDSTVRTVGPIDRAEVQNAISGPIIVVDKATNIAIPTSNTLDGLEYWIYSQATLEGIFATTKQPSSINLDWIRVYNIPLTDSGTSSDRDNQGTFAIYQRKGLAYQLINFYTVPTSKEDLRLGHQVYFVQDSVDSYRLFVHAEGDSTEPNQGRIYYFDKNATEDWAIGTDPQYRGDFRSTGTYFEGETVKFGETVYKAKTNLVPGTFNVSQWEVVTGGLDIVGYVPNDTNYSIDESVVEQELLEKFGEKFDVSKNGNVLIATAEYTNHDDSSLPNTKVVVYRKVNGQYAYSQLLQGNTIEEQFGSDIAISADGRKIAVGASQNGDVSPGNGCVYLYIQQDDQFVYQQTIYPVIKTANVRFGSRLDFDGDTLAITSKGGDISTPTYFDNGVTSFDNSNTEFLKVDDNSGLVSIYETVNNSVIYGQDFAYDRDTEDFGSIIRVQGNHVYVGLPKQSVTINNAVDKGVVAEYRKPFNTTSWSRLRQPVDPANLEKFTGLFLYNTTNNQLVTYLDYIDPIQGKIAGPAEQEIDFKTSYDPARYSVSTNANVKANELDYISTEWVGKIWWDIDSCTFIDHHQGDVISATTNFNKLFAGTTVDVHEWVETTLLPSEWDAQTDTEEGLTKGISGTSVYGDSVYSKRRVYNTASQSFTNYYYYWVKNKKTLPPVDNRNVTAFDVSRYIADPASMGHRFVALLGNNRFTLFNCDSLIQGKEVALSFNWYTGVDREQNIHSQYQLISDGLSTSVPNTEIQQKWIDSLVGFDLNDRPVPDLDLPVKQKYGNLNEPRQGWFINRTEARKQFIERTNKVLKANLVVDEIDVSLLNRFDPQPTVASGIFDTTSDTYAEIGFISIANVKQAKLQLEIENGVIINVNVVDKGLGYINEPTYVITDTQGTEAELELNLDSRGSIESVTIIRGGKNYTNNATIAVRPFAVLVKADENIGGKWSVHQYTNNMYTRTATQSYDTRAYWSYADWYAVGYNQFTQINHTIDGSYQLAGLADRIGDVVKISSVGTGGWLLLQKVDNQDTTDYSINYKTIGRENGTIQFARSLYDVNADNVAFDGANYDKIFYDTEPVEEMRQIINAIRTNIFVDDLAIHWNELFFASLRYVFQEQPNVDWAFKTSFIKAKHNVGELAQKITFKNDSLPSYEQYVEEMKPYKTKIREYLSSYEKVDDARNSVTDFDLPPVYSVEAGKIIPQSVQIVDNTVYSGGTDLTKYPAKHWADNVGYQIKSISIADAGSGYTIAPVIRITGGGGTGAEATAFVGNGKLTAVTVTKPGNGYITQPNIEVVGSIEEGGTQARLSAILGEGKARTASIRCKFDRVTKSFLFQQLEQTETFTSTVDQLFIDLKWPMELRSTNITVTIDGLESLRSEYTFDNIEDTSKGYTRYYGRISFTKALDPQKNIVITYNKAPDLLQAQDRINLYYSPTTGMYGNDLAQLMDGIDYGGVEVTSFDFGSGSGFDSDAWFTTTYDTFDTTYEDEVFQLDGSTEVFQLSKPLEDGVEYNVYLNGKRIDDPNFDPDDSSAVTNDDAVMRSITGDGEQTTVTIFNTTQRFRDGDVVVIRKKSSDGAVIPDPRSYDTLLSGGDLIFSTAKGINPEEIIIDGDGFVTPTTSKGPEELVPGQILDAVDIKVFHRTEKGGSMISSNSYDGDGTTTRFKFGIQPQSKTALFVTVDRVLYAQTAYTVDYPNKEIVFGTAPAANTRINVMSISGNGENILEQAQITGDGCTTNFVTKARYTTKLDYIATVNGEQVESVLVSSADGSTEGEDAKAVISFGSAPADNSVINYIVYSKVDSFSKIETQEFTGDGSTVDFTLTKTPYSAKPNSHNVIVKVDNKILNPGYNQQFNITAQQREYYLEIWQSPVGSFEAKDILVLINGEEKEIAVDYNIRPANSSVILNAGIGGDGDVLEVYLRTDGDYAFGEVEIFDGNERWTDSANVLKFGTAPAEDAKITVYTFNKHDYMDFEREQFDIISRTTLVAGSEDDKQFERIKGGLLKLRYPAIDDQYVWLTINGILQIPSVDYVLTDDRKYLRYKDSFAANDAVEVIQFSATGAIVPQFGFSQFKDMLNRNIYKRLGHTAPLKLEVDLLNTDKIIYLEDASTLSAPDKNSKIPGIIFINGERIEYLIKDGNTLKQIQRATLGTGAPEVHLAGSDVYNADATQTAPYVDKTVVEELIGDETSSTFPLSFVASSVNEFEVFVKGRRLRKNAIQKFDVTRDQDSPEADVTAPAEFSINTVTENGVKTTFLTLYNYSPDDQEKVRVVRKTGNTWTETGESLKDSKNPVARFFRAEKVELPK